MIYLAPASSSRCSSGTSEYHSSISRQQSEKVASATGNSDTAADHDEVDNDQKSMLPVVQPELDTSWRGNDNDAVNSSSTLAPPRLLLPADASSPTSASPSRRDHVSNSRLSRTLDLSVTQLPVTSSHAKQGDVKKPTTRLANKSKRTAVSSSAAPATASSALLSVKSASKDRSQPTTTANGGESVSSAYTFHRISILK